MPTEENIPLRSLETKMQTDFCRTRKKGLARSATIFLVCFIGKTGETVPVGDEAESQQWDSGLCVRLGASQNLNASSLLSECIFFRSECICFRSESELLMHTCA